MPVHWLAAIGPYNKSIVLSFSRRKIRGAWLPPFGKRLRRFAK